MWKIENDLPAVFASIRKNYNCEYQCKRDAFELEMMRRKGWKEKTIREWIPRLVKLGYIKMRGPNVIQMCMVKDDIMIPYKFMKGQMEL